MSELVLITGGTGLIGSRLTKLLLEEGYGVRHLSRNPKKATNIPTYHWDVEKGILDDESLQGVDYIIHLAGEGLADKKWTREQKSKIISSRVRSSQLLHQKVREQKIPLKAFISASAVGYYGAETTKRIFTEEDPAANDFLGQCCQLWEAAAVKFAGMTRVVKIRTAIVLSGEGGAFPKLARPVKMGLGSKLGRGDQWMPWIHIDDLIRIYLFAIQHNLIGSYNAAADEHISNNDFIKKTAEVYRRPYFLPGVPETALKLIMGERAEMLLEGSRVANDKIKSTGFKFHYSTLKPALEKIRN